MSQGNAGVGAHSLAKRHPWPSGAHRRTARVAEWPIWLSGSHGRVTYVAKRCPRPIGFKNLTSAAHNFAEVTHFRAFSKFVRSTRQVFARCCLGWGRDMSRLAAGAASQAAHNRQGTLYRLGSLGGAIAINRRSIGNANVYGAECKTIESMNRARYRRASPSAVRP